MMSPEITMTNRVRFRVLRAEKDWREVLALVREAAATPGYRVPASESVERVAARIAEIKAAIRNWTLDEALLRGQRRAARRGNAPTGQRQRPAAPRTDG